jgi:hypothetical protein
VAAAVSRRQLLLAAALVAYAVSLRLLPHPANFAPLTAVAIFGGAYLSKRLSVAMVLAAAIVSDMLVGFYGLGVMLAVWACYVLITLASHRWLRRRPTVLAGGLMTVSSSLFFFAVTNFAVWADGGLYAHNLTGLERCFVMALPFFRNSLGGDLFYTATLFAIAAWALALAQYVNVSGDRGNKYYI